MVSYNADQVKAIRAGEAGGLPVSGEWKSDNNGWWYQHSDGTYSKNAWEEIDGKWYVFDENGYMRTGWIDWNGEQYYCDNSGWLYSGLRWKNQEKLIKQYAVIISHIGLKLCQR